MVVVKGESTQHLKDLHLMAEDLYLPSFLVKDAGITQVPSGSVTVFGVFGEDEDVNKITGRLKVLWKKYQKNQGIFKLGVSVLILGHFSDIHWAQRNEFFFWDLESVEKCA